MASYNVVLGADEKALNAFISAVYNTARTTVFHGTIPVGHLHLGPLERVEYDIATTPKVLVPASPATPSPGEVASRAVVTLAVDRFALVLHYAGQVPPTTFEGSLQADIGIVADADGVLTPQLGRVVVEIAQEAKLSEVINKVLVPYVDRFLRSQVLTPIRVPPLGYGQLTLTGPALSSGAGRLLATTAIAPGPVAPAPVTWAWPNGRVFLAADFDFLNTLAAAAVPSIEPATGHWSKTYKVGPIRSTLKADYTGTLTSIELGPVAGKPEQITGTAVIDTHVHAYAKRLGSVTGKGTTSVGLDCKTVFDAENAVAIQLVGLNQVTPSIDFHNIPHWFEDNLGDFISALSAQFRAVISASLSAQPPIVVGHLPSLPMTLNGTTLILDVTQPAITTTTGPDGRALLSATGVPEAHTSS